MIAIGREWSNMNATDISTLESLLEYFDTYAASQAMVVLNEFNGGDYFIPPAYGQNGVIKRTALSREEISNHLLDIYPNPADYMVTLKFNNELPTIEMCSLIVTDILGREAYRAQINPAQMQFVINTKDWAVGLYTYKIVVPNSSMEFNGKFDVVH